MKTVLVQIGRRTLEVEVLGEGDPSTVQTLEIQADIENGLAVKQAIVAYLQRRYWFLKDDVLEEEPSQRFEQTPALEAALVCDLLGCSNRTARFAFAQHGTAGEQQARGAGQSAANLGARNSACRNSCGSRSCR